MVAFVVDPQHDAPIMVRRAPPECSPTDRRGHARCAALMPASRLRPLRGRGPRIALAVFCLALFVGAACYRGHSVESMDGRTYAQMIRGVAEHGLPYWDNGPMDRFPELAPFRLGQPDLLRTAPWRGPIEMTVADQAIYTMPVALFVAVFGALVFLARRRRVTVAAVLVVAVIVGAAVPILRTRLLQYGALFVGNVVDLSFIELAAPYYRATPGALGHMYGGWVAKSTLQCTPLFVLAPLALWRPSRPGNPGKERWPLLAMFLPRARRCMGRSSRARTSRTCTRSAFRGCTSATRCPRCRSCSS